MTAHPSIPDTPGATPDKRPPRAHPPAREGHVPGGEKATPPHTHGTAAGAPLPSREPRKGDDHA